MRLACSMVQARAHDDIFIITVKEEEHVTVVKADSFTCTTNSTSGHIVATFSTERRKELLSSLNTTGVGLTGLMPPPSKNVDQATTHSFPPSSSSLLRNLAITCSTSSSSNYLSTCSSLELSVCN